jgi:hypothetical protein
VDVDSDGNIPIKLSVTPSPTIGVAKPATYQIGDPKAGGAQDNVVNVTPFQGGNPVQGTLTLTAGPSIKLSQMKVTVNFTPILSGRVNLYYSAQDLTTGTLYHCLPFTTVHNATESTPIQVPIIVDLSDLPAGNTVTFVAVAKDTEDTFSVSSVDIKP